MYLQFKCCKSPFVFPLDSPEVQPRFVKGSKRYGRRSAPEFIHTDSHTQAEDEEEKDEDAQENDDRTVPRKREVTNADINNGEAQRLSHILLIWNHPYLNTQTR